MWNSDGEVCPFSPPLLALPGDQRKHLNSGWLCVVFLNFSPGTWMIHPCRLPGVACDGYPCIQHFYHFYHFYHIRT